MPVYTKTGDDGTTSLLFGGRVSKADLRTEAYGTMDQAVSAMGLARALCSEEHVKGILLRVQREMFTLGAELATDPAQRDKLVEHFGQITSEMVGALERHIDDVGSRVDLPRAFVVPGGSAGSGALDLARSIARGAERRVVALKDSGQLANPEVLRYLNRLSDLLFMLARLEDKDLPVELASDSESAG